MSPRRFCWVLRELPWPHVVLPMWLQLFYGKPQPAGDVGGITFQARSRMAYPKRLTFRRRSLGETRLPLHERGGSPWSNHNFGIFRCGQRAKEFEAVSE
jgi:hypothetical protein